MSKNSKKNKNKAGKHNPLAESAKAVFDEPKAKGEEFVPKTFK